MALEKYRLPSLYDKQAKQYLSNLELEQKIDDVKQSTPPKKVAKTNIDKDE